MQQIIKDLIQKSLEIFISNNDLILPDNLQIVIDRPKDSSNGDFSSNIAMILAKKFGMTPLMLAEKLINNIPKQNDISKISCAHPGFINFTISNEYLLAEFESMWLSNSCGVNTKNNNDTIIVDYSSPNLAKEMHIGHLRSTIIGDAIANILAFQGNHVIRQNHVGDWGTQFGMLLAYIESIVNHQPLDSALQDLEIFYKEAKKRFDNDHEFANRSRQLVVELQSGDKHCFRLWQNFIELSLAHCQNVYERLGVKLQKTDIRAESAYNDDLPKIIQTLQEQNLLVEANGAKCVFLDGFIGKDQEPLPIIVQKKDGGFLYASTDLAALNYRQHTLHAKRIIYVVDARQALHFQQVFALAQKASFVENDTILEHVSFGMVLDKSGKPFKSRDGGVTKLSDLLDEAKTRAEKLILSKQPDLNPEELKHIAETIAISSVKYADLSKNRSSDYIFDWDTMLSFEGNTAPYLLYAYTRINSLFNKANIELDDLKANLILKDTLDLAMVKQLIMFPEVINTAAIKSSPHIICTYLYDLSSLFSSFYEACPILNQEDKHLLLSRLKIAGMTSKVLKQGLELLGIKTLIKM